MSYLDEVKYMYSKLMAARKTAHPSSKHYAKLDRQMRRLRQDARVAHRADAEMREKFFASDQHVPRTSAVNRRTPDNINLSKTEHGQL